MSIHQSSTPCHRETETAHYEPYCLRGMLSAMHTVFCKAFLFCTFFRCVSLCFCPMLARTYQRRPGRLLKWKRKDSLNDQCKSVFFDPELETNNIPGVLTGWQWTTFQNWMEHFRTFSTKKHLENHLNHENKWSWYQSIPEQLYLTSKHYSQGAASVPSHRAWQFSQN